MKTKSFLIPAFLFFSIWSVAQVPAKITVEQQKAETTVAPNMYGIFFEDINFAADGGLYAELIKNRSFDFPNSPFMGWLTYGKVSVQTEGAPFSRNPHYARLLNDGLLTGTGLLNEGFRGIGVEKNKKYNLSLYAKNVNKDENKLKIEIISAANEIIASGEVEINSGNWEKYKLELQAKETCAHAKLRVDLISQGELDIEHVSLFPAETWRNRENGMRKDLAQALAELKPGVFRFPGGCIIEGNNLETRYQWKNSVGPVENRPVNENRWNYVFQHRFTPDYFQSYGLGFFEYFQLCEDFGADALPVVSCGMACQFITDECVPVDDLDPYIQDALDLVEFANGPVTSKWGKVRAEMGHPESFGLRYIGIGNEQWGEVFPKHLEAFQKALDEKYPEIQIIGSSGPSADGEQFDYLWGEMKKMDVDLVDEHYYKDPDWFLQNADRYDDYSRKGPKVFAGEYACHVQPEKKNSFYAALCEASFLTGIERNSDVVRLATYAPLFAHVDAWQWKPDMIWFDNLRSVKSANYYVQQLYSKYKGTTVQNVKMNGENVVGQDGIYASVVTDKDNDQLILKISNTGKSEKEVELDFKLKELPSVLKGKQITLKANLDDENTLDEPFLVKPVEKEVALDSKSPKISIEAESFHVFVLDL
ncbi:alpha-L-arabinofuranosidase C-terminal domain-containing protein [Maribellus maritimus]|uniref:alpha-L-arabinofuranosidase C-terminal domain-containing protein n=1 Tax=Maribellus maritimus TaxID=2870838 RepID=UPI001EE9CA9B|nr:alpha-L-arabinofuranosidase C-terminal domain-containing protein [Maribellus maritimus]MCG6187538.1 carbohydrate binding domain-containing protein [Maribellus maritimus]